MDLPGSNVIEGEQLAKTWCAGCHRFPEPELLNREAWMTMTLPVMGPFLGIYNYEGEEYPLDSTPELPENFYPDSALISEDSWRKILAYYEASAPDSLDFPQPAPAIIMDDLFFEPLRPDYTPDVNPMASSVRFDPESERIFLADAALEQLLVFNRDLNMETSLELSGQVSNLLLLERPPGTERRDFLITYIGDIAPSDRKDGSVIRGWYDPASGEGGVGSVIIEDLGRPVQTQLADIDGDGYEDLLINEFGHRTGSVFWLRGSQTGFEQNRRLILDAPGCLKSEIRDLTKNGLPDLLILCSQADQALYLFENQGGGQFTRSTLLEFPITAGSSSFTLHDMNGDSHPDILYTSGDNADYSMTYKPYHGVYLYLNDGNNRFEQEWFYPVNGAYNVAAGDFNHNGRMDFVVISFFADYAQKPYEGFLFFRNEGGEKISFSPFHPPAASYGRWITMDVADWTGNGVPDVVLANFSRGPTRVHPHIESILVRSPHLLLLENRSQE